jgi:hypothetical protein
MIRQAQTYLVSAMSGATLIAIAIVGFVLLVSVQVFRDWPIAALGGNDGPHISDSRAISTPSAASTATAFQTESAAAQAPSRKAPGPGSGGAGATQTQVSEGGQAPSAGPTATTNPVDSPEAGAGNQGSQAPSTSPASQSPANSGGNTGSASSGGNSGSGSDTAATPTAKLTETVNETVNQVDETVTGGALGKTGVTEATEGVVNGVAGPESPVGKVVDGTVETVTGLLGGKK